MVSPCRTCSLEYVDKNNDTCMRCAKRIKYCESLDGLTCSVPVEMTDMAISRQQTKEHDQFIRDNMDRPAAEVAKHLGRSVQSIYSRRNKLWLTKAKFFREARAAAEKIKPEDRPAAGKDSTAVVRAAEVTPAADLVLINVKGYEDLYERLKQCAMQNFRTPELQALWFIHQGLAAEGGACDQRRAPDGAA